MSISSSSPAGLGHGRLLLARALWALPVLALAVGCTDSRIASPEVDPTTADGVIVVFDGTSAGVVLDHRPPIPERFAEIRLGGRGFQDFVQLTDDALEEALGRADNVALIGLKPVHASRTATTGVVAAMERKEIEAGLARVETVGGRVVRTFASLPIVVALLPPGTGSELLGWEEINYVEPRGTVESLGVPSGVPASTLPPPQDTAWGVFAIRAHLAWTKNRGHDASITFIDSGVDVTHVTSGDGPVRLVDCLLADTTIGSTCFDENGHGSHVAGIAAARDDSEGYIGVAHYEGSPSAPSNGSVRICPASSVLPCSLGGLIGALEWTASNGKSRQVVNMSMGTNPHASLEVAVGQSVAAGNLLVAAAGNAGASTIPAPARYASVIAVSGTLEDDSFADEYTCSTSTPKSNHGQEIDLSAPFWAVSMHVEGGYQKKCGTSMSTAYVSGAAALVWSENPTWTAAQVRSQLESTAHDLGASGWDQYFGHGRLDVAAAVGIELPSVEISGPPVVDTGGVYKWTAEASGGMGSYTYEWYWQIDFQTPTCNYQTAWILVEDEKDFYTLTVSELDYDFRLRVGVNTHGESATDGVKVYVGDGSQVCPT